MPGTIVTIAQQKGGSGKTTLAAHLAVAAARVDGLAVGILDVDPQGSLGEWFERREERLGGDAGMGFRTASGWGARREARALARDYDVVIVDTPPKSDLEAKPAIEAASLVVIPIQPTPVDLWSSGATLKIVARENVPSVFVVNRVPPRALITGEMLAEIERLGAPIAKIRIGNRVAFAASMMEGSTVLETDAAGKAASEILALLREIVLPRLPD